MLPTLQKEFTFQYVSILINKPRFFIFPLNHIYIPICFYFNNDVSKPKSKPKKIYIPICFYFNNQEQRKQDKQKEIYIPICFYFNGSGNDIPLWWLWQFTFQYVSILMSRETTKNLSSSAFTFQYVSILIHRPNSRFFSTLFPHFLLTSQSLQIFYHISFINSTKEKQNHLFFMFVEFCRCTGIFTLSEGDSLKIVGTE